MTLFPVRLARSCALLRGVALALLLALLPLPGSAAQRTFANPEAAVEALIAACKADDDAAFIALFGDEHKRLVISADRAENSARRAKALAALQAMRVLEASGDDRRVLLMGEEAWPLPIPLVREKGVWRFATEEGEDEILNRRIGANERQALAVLHDYLAAQREYAAHDHNGDGVLEYAQRIASTPGRKDGLYWPADPAKGEEVSPLGPLLAAAGHSAERKAGEAFHGYYFRILTRQGKSAPGEAYNYVINGRMIAGFAMIAYPAEYGSTGVMSFIVNHNGTIYQKDLGKGTTAVARAIREFNPDRSWQPLKD